MAGMLCDAHLTCIDIYLSRSYLFDIFLGPSYNQTAPSVKYMTVSHDG